MHWPSTSIELTVVGSVGAGVDGVVGGCVGAALVGAEVVVGAAMVGGQSRLGSATNWSAGTRENH